MTAQELADLFDGFAQEMLQLADQAGNDVNRAYWRGGAAAWQVAAEHVLERMS